MNIRLNDRLIYLYQREKTEGMRTLMSLEEIPNMKEIADRQNQHLRVLNFSDVRRSMRFNPLQLKYIPKIQDAITYADRLINIFWQDKADVIGKDMAVNILAACIWFMLNHEKTPYIDKKTPLWPERHLDPKTNRMVLTGRAFITEAHRDAAEAAAKRKEIYTEGLTEPAYWLGKYSDIPHVLSLLSLNFFDFHEIFRSGTTPEVYPLIAPAISAFDNKELYILETALNIIRIPLTRIATKEVFWILSKYGDDFDLSDKYNSDYLLLTDSHTHDMMLDILGLIVCGCIPSEKCKLEMNMKTHGVVELLNESLNIETYTFVNNEFMESMLNDYFNLVTDEINNMINNIQNEYRKRYEHQ